MKTRVDVALLLKDSRHIRWNACFINERLTKLVVPNQTHLDSFMFLSPLMKITRHWLEFKDGRKHCFTLSLQDASEVKVSREALVFVLWIHGAALKSKTLLFIAVNWKAFKETVIQCSHYFSMIMWSLHVWILVLWVWVSEQVLNRQIKVLLEIFWYVHMKLRSLF